MSSFNYLDRRAVKIPTNCCVLQWLGDIYNVLNIALFLITNLLYDKVLQYRYLFNIQQYFTIDWLIDFENNYRISFPFF